jgi:putative transposase
VRKSLDTTQYQAFYGKIKLLWRAIIMAKSKNIHQVEMTEGKRSIIQQLLQEYDIETAEDIQDALKDLLGGTIKEIIEAEMEHHLGYEK